MSSSSASTRVNALVSQLTPSLTASSSASTGPRDDDIVIVSAVRTAIGKAGKGWYKDMFPEDLLKCVIAHTVQKTKIDPSSIGDIVVGSVLGQGAVRANECRQAALMAGVPDTVPIHVVNRQCSSGLQSIASVAASIRNGYYDIGLACGLEHMSSASMAAAAPTKVNPFVFLNQQARDCLIPMGITSENVAKDFGVTRADQDAFSAVSNQRAAAFRKSGNHKESIVPMTVRMKDPKTGDVKEVVADFDDGVRADTTAESLAKLQPAFQKGGSTTAGNSSQVSDGAAAVLLMSRKKAKELGFAPMATFVSFAVSGVPPRVMGIGPAFAIPAALKQANLTLDDIDVFEINEAFASQALYCVNKLNIPKNKVNPNGGAIAIGHPLGATGGRMTADLLAQLRRNKQKYGIVSMCIGSGMGAAAVFRNEA